MSPASWEIIRTRFGYLEQMEVIKVREVIPGQFLPVAGFEVFAFRTDHGAFARGSVGYLIRNRSGTPSRIVYTSDFMNLPEIPDEIMQPEILILPCWRLNEPVKNTPHHLSFQRAMEFMKILKPTTGIFLVHIGDGDPVPGDPANSMAKKREPANPLSPPGSSHPYPIPKNQAEWQSAVNRILSDYNLNFKCTVAFDGLTITF
jgi:phosphoribosyl 1,2-cyclic phosphate phosphodiesterase